MSAELALLELLEGPESAWAESYVPTLTTLDTITISSGVAQVNFVGSSSADWSGGSCRVTALRSQVEQTLLQFPSISSVEITVNGSSDILEP